MWKPTFGTVTLDVVFADRAVKGVTCSPLHATILHHFGEQSTWTLSALAAEMKLKPDVTVARFEPTVVDPPTGYGRYIR